MIQATTKCCLMVAGIVFFITGLGHGAIGFDPATNLAVSDQPESTALGDWNGDGNLDMAITSDNPDKVSIFLNLGGGAFGPASNVFLAGGSSPHAVLAGDFDGQTGLDLAVTLKGTNSVQLLINNGSGVFSLGSSFGVGLEPRQMTQGDLDGNGHLDLVTSNRDSDNVSVLLNTGAAAFSTAVNYTVGQDPRSVTVGDLTGDLALDIAVSSNDDREINILRNSGSGTFTADPSLSTGLQLRPEGIVTVDLDCDGILDLAASTSGNALNMVSVFLNNGSGTFSGRTDFPIRGDDPSFIVSGDFDADSNGDVATVNTDSNNVSALAGNGLGALGASVEFAVGTEPGHLVAGDLDGNGSFDLVATNNLSNDVSILINQNASPLVADGETVSVTTGGVVNFHLIAGSANAGRTYLVLGSLSGTSPGIPLPGGLTNLPVNWDSFTDLVLAKLNGPIFSGFFGALDLSGESTATLNAPSVNPAKIGKVMHYAYVLEGPPWDFASNPVKVVFVP